MTAARQALLNDAYKAGYEITSDLVGTTYITKQYGPKTWDQKHGLVIYEDGTAFDVQVPLSLAKGIRSYAIMRHILRIN